MKKILVLLFSIIINQLYAQGLLSNLRGCYTLDNTAVNSATTGVPYNGTANNVSGTTGHLGAANTAYQFNGATNSYVSLPSTATFLRPSNAISVSGWYCVTTPTSGALPHQYLVFTKNNCGSN